jgi:hypothetical protein
MSPGISSLVLSHGAGGLPRLSSGELPRGEVSGEVSLGKGPFNKCEFVHFLVGYFNAFLPRLVGRGGGRKEELGVVVCAVRRWSREAVRCCALFPSEFNQSPSPAGRGGVGRGWRICTPVVQVARQREAVAATSSCSTVDLARPLIFDAHGWHLMTPWMRLFNLQQRRPPFDGATMTPCAAFFPSGLVPGEEDGGRRRQPSPKLIGEAQGLDGFFSKVCEILCVCFLDPVVIFIFRWVLLVICTTDSFNAAL